MSDHNDERDPRLLFSTSEVYPEDVEDDYLPFPPNRGAVVQAHHLGEEEIRRTACEAVESPEFRLLSSEAKLLLVTLYFHSEMSRSHSCPVGKLWYFSGMEDPRQFAAALAELESARWTSRQGQCLLPRPFDDQVVTLPVSFPESILPLTERMVATFADFKINTRFS